MERLGLWGTGSPFPEGFGQFRSAVDKGGVRMLELVAMHIRKQGVYMCRTLSFEGCKFNIVEDSVSDKEIELYDKAAVLWQDLLMELKIELQDEKFLDRFLTSGGGNGKARKSVPVISNGGNGESKNIEQSNSDSSDNFDSNDDDEDELFVENEDDDDGIGPLKISARGNAQSQLMR